jgi:hypothetical protein
VQHREPGEGGEDGVQEGFGEEPLHVLAGEEQRLERGADVAEEPAGHGGRNDVEREEAERGAGEGRAELIRELHLLGGRDTMPHSPPLLGKRKGEAFEVGHVGEGRQDGERGAGGIVGTVFHHYAQRLEPRKGRQGRGAGLRGCAVRVFEQELLEVGQRRSDGTEEGGPVGAAVAVEEVERAQRGGQLGEHGEPVELGELGEFALGPRELEFGDADALPGDRAQESGAGPGRRILHAEGAQPGRQERRRCRCCHLLAAVTKHIEVGERGRGGEQGFRQAVVRHVERLQGGQQGQHEERPRAVRAQEPDPLAAELAHQTEGALDVVQLVRRRVPGFLRANGAPPADEFDAAAGGGEEVQEGGRLKAAEGAWRRAVDPEGREASLLTTKP